MRGDIPVAAFRAMLSAKSVTTHERVKRKTGSGQKPKDAYSRRWEKKK